MPTVTDLDTCAGSDGGETVSLPRVTVTGISVSDGAGGPAQGLVFFDSGQLEDVPGIGGPSGVIENPAVAQVYNGVMVTVSLPDTNLAFAAVFTYTITLKIEGFDDQVITGVEISKLKYPSGTCDLSQLV